MKTTIEEIPVYIWKQDTKESRDQGFEADAHIRQAAAGGRPDLAKQLAEHYMRKGAIEFERNPVVPFRHSAKSSTGKRIDPQALNYNQLMIIASSYTDDPERAKAMVDAFFAGARQRERIHSKGKLVSFKNNPDMVKIYQKCIEIRATKAGMHHHCDDKCKAAGHRYKHPFVKSACIYGLPDGSLLIR